MFRLELLPLDLFIWWRASQVPGDLYKSDSETSPIVSRKRATVQVSTGCILRQSWQNGVITVRLTHQHGYDLSPPGREIAKSQFTHIELPVQAWSRSCKMGKPPTDTHVHPPSCSNSRHSCQPLLEAPSFSILFHMRALHALVCHHMPWPGPCFLSNTPPRTIKARGMTALRRCVCEREQLRASNRQMTPQWCLIYIPLWIIIPPWMMAALIHWHTGVAQMQRRMQLRQGFSL